MAITVTIAPDDVTITTGESQEFIATVAGAAEGAVLSYVWTVDDQPQSSVTNKMTYKSTLAGGHNIKVVASSKVGEDPAETAEATAMLSVNDAQMEVTAVASANLTTVTVGDDIILTCEVSGQPSGATLTYDWQEFGNTKTVTVKAETVGPNVFSCIVAATAPGYTPTTTQSNEVTVTVEEKAEPEIPEHCPLIYVHPLPWRSSAYIWAGWWVMDEIERLTKEGKDWKTEYAGSRYECHLAVLAKMLVDYPEVDVQESRNGRIVHRSALEVGIIY